MKCQKNLAGYTIIEVMLFLIISGALLTSIMAVVSGQQRRTQFNTGSREFESRLQDVMSDVEIGYSGGITNSKCEVNGIYTNPDAAPTEVAGAGDQGVSQDCVFLGKAIQFYKGNDGLVDKYRVARIVGKRVDFNSSTGKTEDPASLEAAEPTVLSTDGFEEGNIPYGIEVTQIITGFHGARRTDLTQLAIVPSTAIKTTNNIASNIGAGRTLLAAMSGDPAFTDNSSRLKSEVSNLSDASVRTGTGGTVICLRDGGIGARAAAISIGVYLSDNGNGSNQILPTSDSTATQLYTDDQAQALGCAS